MPPRLCPLPATGRDCRHCRSPTANRAAAMPSISTLLIALILLPAMVAAALTWYAVLSVESELADFEGFEGMHLEK